MHDVFIAYMCMPLANMCMPSKARQTLSDLHAAPCASLFLEVSGCIMPAHTHVLRLRPADLYTVLDVFIVPVKK